MIHYNDYCNCIIKVSCFVLLNSGLPFSRVPFSTLCFPVCQIQVCHFQSPHAVAYLGGALGDAPLWPEHKIFLNTLNQIFFNSGVPRPLLQWGGDTPSPHSTPLAPPAPRTSRLWLWPPSQNPKYATGPTLCTSGFTDGITYEYVFPQ